MLNISAGGLKFACSDLFETGTRLYFNIYVYNMLSEFNMKFEGIVMRSMKSRNTYSHAVKFDNVNKLYQVQLDELIRSRLSLTDQVRPASEEEVYTMLLVSNLRSVRR
jgi:hypothetical protein